MAASPRARWSIALAPAAALVLAATGCGKGSEPPADTATARPPVAAAPGPSGPPACPRTGHWSPCHVFERIDRAGLAPRDTTSLGELPPLDAKPILYKVGRAGLAVYLFDDSLARARAGRTLDTTKFVANTRAMTMLTEATVIQNDNLLALLFTKNDHQRERVADALTAGPPQP
jgi:hypothetical protein